MALTHRQGDTSSKHLETPGELAVRTQTFLDWGYIMDTSMTAEGAQLSTKAQFLLESHTVAKFGGSEPEVTADHFGWSIAQVGSAGVKLSRDTGETAVLEHNPYCTWDNEEAYKKAQKAIDNATPDASEDRFKKHRALWLKHNHSQLSDAAKAKQAAWRKGTLIPYYQAMLKKPLSPEVIRRLGIVYMAKEQAKAGFKSLFSKLPAPPKGAGDDSEDDATPKGSARRPKRTTGDDDDPSYVPGASDDESEEDNLAGEVEMEDAIEDDGAANTPTQAPPPATPVAGKKKKRPGSNDGQDQPSAKKQKQSPAKTPTQRKTPDTRASKKAITAAAAAVAGGDAGSPAANRAVINGLHGPSQAATAAERIVSVNFDDVDREDALLFNAGRVRARRAAPVPQPINPKARESPTAAPMPAAAATTTLIDRIRAAMPPFQLNARGATATAVGSRVNASAGLIGKRGRGRPSGASPAPSSRVTSSAASGATPGSRVGAPARAARSRSPQKRAVAEGEWLGGGGLRGAGRKD